jgi:hypothetical protein
MNRITHADVVQHNGPRIHMLALALVSTFFGATNDATRDVTNGHLHLVRN